MRREFTLQLYDRPKLKTHTFNGRPISQATYDALYKAFNPDVLPEGRGNWGEIVRLQPGHSRSEM